MSPPSKTKRSAGFFWIALLCLAQLMVGGCGKKDSASNGSEGPTEVVVISTQHFVSDMPEGFTPGHLRALLEKIAPDTLAVEAPSNVKDPMSIAPYELQSVTHPWATQSGIEVVPCGWNEPQYQKQTGQMFQQFQTDGKADQFQRIERETQSAIAAKEMTCEFMNSEGWHQLMREYHASLHELAGEDTPWEKWNARILENIQQACRNHAGKRVAIVFGGAHSYYFLDQLANDPNVKLIPVEQFLPLTEQEVTAKTQPIDYLKAMRPLNLNVISKEQLAQVKPLLEKVNEVPEFAADYIMFHGRCLLHERKAKEALAEFQKLTKYPRDTLMKYDENSRIAEAAMVYSALAMKQMGNTKEAKQTLNDIANDDGITQSTRQWAQQLLTGM